jgi:hypothetical protein
MCRTVFALLLLVGMTTSVTFPGMCRAADAPAAKVISLDHKTLDFHADGRWQRFELSGSISKGVGKGKIRLTTFQEVPYIRNLFGDRADEALKDAKTTEHEITLELLTSEHHLPAKHRSIPDPSPTKDRVLYVVKGIDLGTNRVLLLMVSSNGPQRLIYLGRCGGVWAATLEPTKSFDGPAKKDE